MTPTANELVELQTSTTSSRLRHQIADVPGFTWQSADRGNLEIEGRVASVRFDSTSDLRLEMKASRQLDPVAALRINAMLPLNLRFALEDRQLVLVADTRSDDFLTVIQELDGGIRQALSESPTTQRQGELTKEAIQEVLRALPNRDDSFVELDDGWEYRPRIGSKPIAVRIHISGDRLHLHRNVMLSPSVNRPIDSAAVEALRINRQIKHARLALADSNFIAESRFANTLINPASLAVAIRAVALAERRSRLPLSILVNHEEFAAQYERVLNSPS